jgi:hypothetical protein
MFRNDPRDLAASLSEMEYRAQSMFCSISLGEASRAGKTMGRFFAWPKVVSQVLQTIGLC